MQCPTFCPHPHPQNDKNVVLKAIFICIDTSDLLSSKRISLYCAIKYDIFQIHMYAGFLYWKRRDSAMDAIKSRISEYDIIKGICILLVAIMHTGHPVYFMEYGFLFAFFFVSGCTFKRKPFLQFLKGKVLRIYIPFVLANFAGYFIGKFYYSLSGYSGYGYSLSDAAKRIFSFQIAENIMSPS